MAVLNRIDRFHLVAEIARRVPSLADRIAESNEWREAKLDAHKAWIRAEGIDLPEIRDWRWRGKNSRK
jgi:xylulose-5-phosphate/fructose-6-phosphate phosphoketolase